MNKKEFYVYIHFRPNGKPFYVGKGSFKRSKDFWNGRNRYHRFIINKYGKENIKIQAYKCENEEHAFKREKYLIKRLRKEGFKIANICDGGEGLSGRKLTKEHKEAISKANKGNKHALGCVRSEEFKENLRRKGQTEEQRRKNSEANKGRPKPYLKGKPWPKARRIAQIKRSEKLCLNQKV